VLFVAGDTGKQFRFQLQANNIEGSSISRVAAFIIADVPDQPLTKPYKVQSLSSRTSLYIKFDLLTELQSGGTTITGYQLQVDDGMAGPYTIVLGEDAERADKVSLESEILLKNLTQGATYRA
jgi:hypothetical protein